MKACGLELGAPGQGLSLGSSPKQHMPEDGGGGALVHGAVLPALCRALGTGDAHGCRTDLGLCPRSRQHTRFGCTLTCPWWAALRACMEVGAVVAVCDHGNRWDNFHARAGAVLTREPLG